MTLIDRLKQLQGHELFFVCNNTLELSGVATKVESDHVVLESEARVGRRRRKRGSQGRLVCESRQPCRCRVPIRAQALRRGCRIAIG